MTEGNGEVKALPKGWALTTVKETIKIIDYRGRTPPYSENGIPHLRSSNIRNRKIVWENLRYVSEETYQAYMTRGLPEKGDVLFTTEAPLGEVALAPEQRFSLAQRMMILRPNKDLLLSKFLLYQIENEEFQRKLSKSGTGTTVTGVSSRNFQPTPIILAPINEQNRIVEKIEELSSELDQGIENLKTAQKQLKVYRQAVLKWAFEGKLTEAWRTQQTYNSPVILKAAQRSEESQTDADDRDSSLRVHSAQNDTRRLTGEALLAQIKAERENRYQQQLAEWETAVKDWETIGKVGKKPTKPQQLKNFLSFTESDVSNLPPLPNSWLYVEIELFLASDKKAMITGPFGTMLKKSDHKDVGVPVLGIENIGDGIFIPRNKIFVSEDKAKELDSFGVIGGDIIISRSGTVGEICCVPERISLSLISTNLMRLSLDQRVVNSKFFVYLFQGGGTVKEQVKELCKGSTRDFLNQNILKSIKFPLPSFEEQEEIVQEIELRLSICDRLEATIIENLQKAEALRQSILKQAFEGKLVPQDPTDEPAEKLLERIKADRQAMRSPKPSKQLKIKGL